MMETLLNTIGVLFNIIGYLLYFAPVVVLYVVLAIFAIGFMYFFGWRGGLIAYTLWGLAVYRVVDEVGIDFVGRREEYEIWQWIALGVHLIFSLIAIIWWMRHYKDKAFILYQPTIEGSRGLSRFALFLVLVGTIIAVSGGFRVIDSLKFSKDKDVVRVEGTVIRSEPTSDTTEDTIVAFVVDGRQYEVRGQIHSDFPPSVGNKVPIVYRTGRPEEAQFDNWFKAMSGIVLVVFGGFLVVDRVIGMILDRWHLHRKKSHPSE